MTIRMVFLDVDGTTVDSEQRNRRAIEEAARVGGHKIQSKDWDHLGGNADGIIWSLITQFKPDFKKVFNDAASFEQACLNTKLDRIHEVKKIEEVFDAINLLRRNDIPVAPVSNSITSDALASLMHAGYAQEDFLFCLFRDDLARKGLRAKPYPDPYEEALRMTNGRLKAAADAAGEAFTPITPSECLIFEDSKTGARAGLAAGMSVLHILDDALPLDADEVEQMEARHNGKYIMVRRTGILNTCKELLQNEAANHKHNRCHISLNPQTFAPPPP